MSDYNMFVPKSAYIWVYGIVELAPSLISTLSKGPAEKILLFHELFQFRQDLYLPVMNGPLRNTSFSGHLMLTFTFEKQSSDQFLFLRAEVVKAG